MLPIQFKKSAIAYKTSIYIATFLFFIYVNSVVYSIKKVEAASLYLNPATGSILTTTFEVTTSLDTATSANIKSVDAYILFNSQLVNVERIEKIGLTTASTATYNNSNGSIHIKGDFVQTPQQSSVINFAKIYFKTLNNSKGSTANFEIDQTIDQSLVIDTQGENVLTQTVGANLLIDTTTQITNNSTGTKVPGTGNINIQIFTILAVLSTFILLIFKKHVATKY